MSDQQFYAASNNFAATNNSGGRLTLLAKRKYRKVKMPARNSILIPVCE